MFLINGSHINKEMDLHHCFLSPRGYLCSTSLISPTLMNMILQLQFLCLTLTSDHDFWLTAFNFGLWPWSSIPSQPGVKFNLVTKNCGSNSSAVGSLQVTILLHVQTNRQTNAGPIIVPFPLRDWSFNIGRGGRNLWKFVKSLFFSIDPPPSDKNVS